jgi:hypothetical protein
MPIPGGPSLPTSYPRVGYICMQKGYTDLLLLQSQKILSCVRYLKITVKWNIQPFLKAQLLGAKDNL